MDANQEGLEPALDTLRQLSELLVASLPLIGIGFLVLLGGLVLARLLAGGVNRALRRTSADTAAVGLLTQLARLAAIVAAVLLAMNVAGLILLIRKPFRAGEQIRSLDFEGTVRDLDLRVTRIETYDGEMVLIPNVDVYTNPLTNLTRSGKRRTRVTIGIDYRDDQDAAREVIREAVAGVEGVLPEPAVQVFLTELGDSSVDFEVRYWTLPDILSVRSTQDRVLSAVKRAVEEAGMSIPWPMRTLVVDGPVALDRSGSEHAAAG